MFRFLIRFAVFSLATYFVCRGVLLVSGTNTLGTAVGPVLIVVAAVCGGFFALVAPAKRKDKLIVERYDDPNSARLGTQLSTLSPEDRARLYSGPERRSGPGRGSEARGTTPVSPEPGSAERS
jgi:hypothetical protein